MKKLKDDVTRRDHYEELTNTIIAKLEDGVLPWRRPWDPRKCSAGESPMNPVTGRAYRGINALALAMSPRAFGGDPRWMSYRQAAGRGWQVRKGEKGAIVFFYKKLEIRSDDEERRTIPLLRAYVVFLTFAARRNPRAWRARGPKAGRRAHRRGRSDREGDVIKSQAAGVDQSGAVVPPRLLGYLISGATGHRQGDPRGLPLRCGHDRAGAGGVCDPGFRARRAADHPVRQRPRSSTGSRSGAWCSDNWQRTGVLAAPHR